MIHAASSEATVKFTFTQISDCWPKAFVTGQINNLLPPYLLWKKTGIHKSNINQNVEIDGYPVPDEISKFMLAPKILAKHNMISVAAILCQAALEGEVLRAFQMPREKYNELPEAELPETI